ncbi:MAG: hypothetical protein IJP64_05505 [Oscillospiraceae bacterium]|nr:hypothetical protein [Oscillospiraceae bacterium]
MRKELEEAYDEELDDEMITREDLREDFEDDEETDGSCIPVLYFHNPDPYAKRTSLPDDHPRRNYRIDEDGHIVVKNLSAWWIPEMKLIEEIDGTIYTVTGSYEGAEHLDQKLFRIMLHNLEDSE